MKVIHQLMVVVVGSVVLPGLSLAQDQEREQLTLLLDQIKNVEALATHSRAVASITNNSRYSFDYAQLLTDIAAIRNGINAYLTPTRAQPRPVLNFEGNYTKEDNRGR